jgi:predicted lipid-binding transport protein (Tim44 family)
MKHLFALVLTLFISFALTTTDAEARRFGGGSSIGKQRQSYSQQQAAPQKPAPAAAPAAPGGNRWLGPLAGLAAGGLLASMFMGNGLGGFNPMSLVLLLGGAAAIFFVFRAMRRNAPAAQPMQYAGGPATGYNPPVGFPASATQAQASSSRPAGFEDEPFLREAKVHFIRLQAAYDSADLNDIREYTTPEMFAEINMQIRERGEARQTTEVVTLDAQMVEVVTEGNQAIASVRFSGLIREEEGGKAEPFNEIWHVHKSLAQQNAPWLVAGIQQVQ